MAEDGLTTVDALAQASFLIQATLQARADENDISMIQMRLLGVLRDREPTLGELAKLLGLDKSSASGLVDRAEKRGLVRRTPSPTDGRSVIVALTEQGHARVDAVAARFQADVEDLLAPLSARQRETLTRMLAQVIEAYAAARGIEL